MYLVKIRAVVDLNIFAFVLLLKGERNKSTTRRLINPLGKG